ncbi:hypothetical protein D3C71_1417620 [compost metagenome]
MPHADPQPALRATGVAPDAVRHARPGIAGLGGRILRAVEQRQMRDRPRPAPVQGQHVPSAGGRREGHRGVGRRLPFRQQVVAHALKGQRVAQEIAKVGERLRFAVARAVLALRPVRARQIGALRRVRRQHHGRAVPERRPLDGDLVHPGHAACAQRQRRQPRRGKPDRPSRAPSRCIHGCLLACRRSGNSHWRSPCIRCCAWRRTISESRAAVAKRLARENNRLIASHPAP